MKFQKLRSQDPLLDRVQDNIGAALTSLEQALKTYADAAAGSGALATVTAIAQLTTTISCPNAAPTVIDYDVIVHDPLGTITTGAAWVFTAPRAATYSVNAYFTIAFNALTAQVTILWDIMVNGAAARSHINYFTRAAGTGDMTFTICSDVVLVTGDTVYIQLTNQDPDGRTFTIPPAQPLLHTISIVSQ